MPRKSSGGRSSSRAVPSRPLRNPPEPARVAPPPAPVQGGGGSMLGGIGASIVDGMALGTGSAIAHRAVDAFLGPRTVQHEMVSSTPAGPAAQLGTPANSVSDACNAQSKAFQDCINNFGSGDIGKCQFYFDMLNECRRGSGAITSS